MSSANGSHSSLKCQACDEMLSVFPIHWIQEGVFICGRCPMLKGNAQRQFAYEEVVKCKQFPCKNKMFGCSTNFPPNQLKMHENECKYVMVHCYVGGCECLVSMKQIEQHFLDKHKALIVNAETFFKISFSNEAEQCFLLKWLDDIFLVRLKRKGLTLLVDVSLIGEFYTVKRNYNYKLYFLCETSDGIIKLQEKAVNYALHSYDNQKINFNKEHFNKISSCKIKIINTDDLNCIKNQLNKPQEFILKQMECPVCLDYMPAPIYQCKNGHVICSTCKKRILNCPQCREEIGNFRNLALENIASNTRLPCQHNGCPFISTLDTHKTHTNTCKYAPYKCPFTKCNFFNGFEELCAHLNKTHKSNLHVNELKTTINCEKIIYTTFNYVIIKNCCIFLLASVLDNNVFKLRVEYFGPRNVNNTFSFELNMQNMLKENLNFKSKCFDKDSQKNTFNFMLPALFLKRGNLWLVEINICEDFIKS